MKKQVEAEKEFLNGKITFNELRERKGLKPVEGGDILLDREKGRTFYLCSGEVPYCRKSSCYKNKNATEGACRHTTNVAYALNFEKVGKGIDYCEKEVG